MDGRRDAAPGRSAHPREHEPESDVGETVAWCENCGGEHRFRKAQADVSRRELASDSPSVQRALTGETGWVCENCGDFRRDLISEQAYDFEYSNVGYDVPQFKDEEETIRERESGGVEPPEQVAGAPAVSDFEATPEDDVERPRERRER